MTREFINQVDQFVEREQVDLIKFEKGVRKDDAAKSYLQNYEYEEGVMFVGKAQEKASVFRTERRYSEQGGSYPWIFRSTAMVNHFYFYINDKDFGPLFIKFCSIQTY